MRIPGLLLPSFFLVISTICRSQPPASVKVNGNFENISLTDFFGRLEKQTPYKFYCNSKQLDSFVIELQVKELPITQTLQEAFKATDIHFAIDTASKSVFITRKAVVETELPDGLFEDNPARSAKSNLADMPEEYDIESERTIKATPGKLYEIGRKTNQPNGTIILTGYVRNARTGEPVPNVSVYIDSLYSTSTDLYGHYSLSVPSGRRTLNVQAIGMKDTKLQLVAYSDGSLDVDMNEEVRTLREVVVSNRKTLNIRNVQMGVERLTIANIKNVPTVFGEADVLRVVTSLPGVKTVGEASTGFNVRGGSADQNLILFNEATIYNPSHFFGLFSAFNPDVVQGIELYKSSIPASYGGRLSSVLDITSREGNKKTLTGSAGIGLITSRVELEGPIVKDKTSFIMGARSTYANWLLGLLPKEYANSKASFQDVRFYYQPFYR